MENRSDGIWRKPNHFWLERLDHDLKGVIIEPIVGSVVVYIDSVSPKWGRRSVEGVGDLKKYIPGGVETSSGAKESVSAMSAAMAYTFFIANIRQLKNGPLAEGGVRVFALTDEAGNWLKTPGEC